MRKKVYTFTPKCVGCGKDNEMVLTLSERDALRLAAQFKTGYSGVNCKDCFEKNRGKDGAKTKQVVDASPPSEEASEAASSVTFSS